MADPVVTHRQGLTLALKAMRSSGGGAGLGGGDGTGPAVSDPNPGMYGTCCARMLENIRSPGTVRSAAGKSWCTGRRPW